MLFWKKTRIIVGVLCAVLYWTSCGDIYRPIAEPIPNPGGDPQRSAFVYALYSNPVTNATGVVSKIDVSGDTNMANMRVGRRPVAEAYLGGSTAGLLLVANLDGTVTSQVQSSFQLPTTRNLYTPPDTPPRPAWIFSNQSTRMFVVNSAGMDVTCPDRGSVSVLSSVSLLTTLCVGTEPTFGLQLPGGGKSYVLNSGDGSVSVIDPVLQRVVDTFAVGGRPVWAVLNVDGSWLFILSQAGASAEGFVTAVNTTTDEILWAPIAVGVMPTSIVFERNRNRLYIPNSGSNTVSIIDLSHATEGDADSDPVVPPVPPVLLANVPTSVVPGHGLRPTAVAPLPDGMRVYVANSGSSDVSVIDTRSNALISGVGQECTVGGGGAVACQAIDTIPILRDFGSPSAPYSSPLSVFAAASADLRIESESSSTKIYVTHPNVVPQTKTDTADGAPDPDPIQPGLIVIRTIDNKISNYILGPQQDLACQPNSPSSNPHVICPTQTPVMILSQPR